MSDEKRGIKAYERLAYGEDGTVSRGTCKKCGGLGHLTFECKNDIKLAAASSRQNKQDPFADEKARLRAEIEQLKREKKERQRRKDKAKLVTYEPDSSGEEDSSSSNGRYRGKRTKHHRRHSRRRSRSPDGSDSSSLSDSSSASDSSGISSESKNAPAHKRSP
ncbi:hypothetical protein IWW36_001114 [Coemansia brasiliensis]|uniref:CCHC-type domain-containing protein n=1 Tax=Coemansia brasiliensis TaxID=2650707 RepID=A0A9W8IA82_9FUNG|nr:hypothetical protein IWW36_001114 [Coemansia brasiliensis]